MLARVSRTNPCPVCGKPDWCAVNCDIAICMRIESPYPTANGGWVHRLHQKLEIPAERFVSRDTNRKPDKKLDKVYRQLLSVLSLSTKHRKHLKSRGMSDFEIKRGMYRTLPADRRNDIVQNILNIFNPEDLIGIPGFGYRYGNLILYGVPGLIIPIISPEGLIVSFLIRPDRQGADYSKYLLLSSRKLEGGSSPSVRLHLAVPPKVESNFLWITEGPLKANIAAYRLNANVLAVPGVSNWKGIMKLPLPDLVVMAYDNDYHNPQVRYHARQLTNALLKKGHKVMVALWKKHKGLDDALVNKTSLALVRARPKK